MLIVHKDARQRSSGTSCVPPSTAFVIRATPECAMLMMPIFAALSMALNNPRLPKTGALLFPTPMLLAALALLLGADARLVTAEIVWPIGGEQSGPS